MMELLDGHNRSRRTVETEELRVDFIDARLELDVGNFRGPCLLGRSAQAAD